MRGIPEDKIRAWIKDVNGRCLNDTWWIEGELLEYIEELQEPWMTLDEFLKSGFRGVCFVFTEHYTILCERTNCGFFAYNSNLVDISAITDVMPIHNPEPPR